MPMDNRKEREMKTINDWYNIPSKVSGLTKGGMIMGAMLILGIFGMILLGTLGFPSVAKMILPGMSFLMFLLLFLGRLKIPQKK